MNLIPDLEPVLGAAAMREADRRTIEDLGIPGPVLMETAGRAVADAVWKRYAAGGAPHVLVVCWHGNNGGDGFVAARVLHARGARVHVLFAGDENRLTEDAGRYYRVLAELGGRSLRRGDPSGSEASHRLAISQDVSDAGLAALGRFDVVIDALLGTGQSRAPRAPLDRLVAWINRSGSAVVAVDIPTGLDADTGAELTECVRARITVAMGARKFGHVLGDGPELCGETIVAEIGIPDDVLRAVVTPKNGAVLSTDRAVLVALASAPRRHHKFTTGPTFVAGGSARYAGAPVLAARAAAVAGSGYVVCCVPDTIVPQVAASLIDIPCVGLPTVVAPDGPSDAAGTVDGNRAADVLLEAAARARSLVLGPGLGRGSGVTDFVRRVLSEWSGPVVVDADGLNALDQDFIVRHSNGRWILTPHAAEFRRLTGTFDDRPPDHAEAAEVAARWNAVVLLKGYPSVMAAPDGTVCICSTGHPGLATAGTGDVLAGVCGGLLARGLEPCAAALCGVHLGGAAADRYAGHSGRNSLTATALLREIGPVLRERFE